MRDIGGGDLMARFEKAGGMDYDDMVLRPWSAMSDADRRTAWVTRPPWWSLPAQTLDRATAHLPELLPAESTTSRDFPTWPFGADRSACV